MNSNAIKNRDRFYEVYWERGTHNKDGRGLRIKIIVFGTVGKKIKITEILNVLIRLFSFLVDISLVSTIIFLLQDNKAVYSKLLTYQRGQLPF